MSKKEYINFGSVLKSKKDGSSYIKISKDIKLEEGEFVNLKAPADEISRVQELMNSGKMGAEQGEKILSRLEKIKEFVRFELEVVREK
jgi:hypothetical protein